MDISEEMGWVHDEAFHLLNVEKFVSARDAYKELVRSQGGSIHPQIGAEVMEIDRIQLCTLSINYVSEKGNLWVQHFRLNHYRRQPDGRYPCEFLTLSPTQEGLELGKRRLEDAVKEVIQTEPSIST